MQSEGSFFSSTLQSPQIMQLTGTVPFRDARPTASSRTFEGLRLLVLYLTDVRSMPSVNHTHMPKTSARRAPTRYLFPRWLPGSLRFAYLCFIGGSFRN